MKRIYLSYFLFTLILLSFPAIRIQAQAPAGDNRIHIHVYEMATDGDSIFVDFDIILKDYPLSSLSHTLLSPVVSDNSGAIYELPPILLEGRQRAKLNSRIQSLKGRQVIATDLYSRVRAKNNLVNNTIPYSYTLPYEPWMFNARLDILADRCGCGLSGSDLEQRMVEVIPRPVTGPFEFTPEIHFIVPQKEAVKDRAESGTAYVTFPVGRHEILTNFGNNAVELGKINESVEYVKSEPTTVIDEIIIRAYASPEGTAESNLLLSQRRSEALKRYVQSLHSIPSAVIMAEGMGENWDGLLEMIGKDPTMDLREEALQIIHHTGINSGRESKLMQLAGGKPYQYMLAVHFPKLRRSDYVIKYTVPGFDLQKAMEVFKSRPGMLSLEEMFLIAQTYNKGSIEFNRVFEVAASIFPDDKVANLNAAAASLYKGDLDYAARTLERYKDDPQAWNNLGVLRIKQNRPEEAEAFLLRAQGNGVAEAGKNLEAVKKLNVYNRQMLPLSEKRKNSRNSTGQGYSSER